MADGDEARTLRAAERRPIFHRERIEYWAFVAQIVSALAVIVSLVFVGLQLRDANRVAVRDEANSLQTQWSAFRSSIYGSHDAANVFQAGMDGRPLDAADRLRFLYIMREHAWATFQLWDRDRQGLRPGDRFDVGAGQDFLRVICTPGGRIAWAEVRRELPPAYVADLDRLAVTFARQHTVRC